MYKLNDNVADLCVGLFYRFLRNIIRAVYAQDVWRRSTLTGVVTNAVTAWQVVHLGFIAVWYATRFRRADDVTDGAWWTQCCRGPGSPKLAPTAQKDHKVTHVVVSRLDVRLIGDAFQSTIEVQNDSTLVNMTSSWTIRVGEQLPTYRHTLAVPVQSYRVLISYVPYSCRIFPNEQY